MDEGKKVVDVTVRRITRERIPSTSPLLGRHIHHDSELRRYAYNSWTADWGVGGRCYLTFDDLGTLLSWQGDVTILLPLSAPAPTPTPPDQDPADIAFAEVAKPWCASWWSGVSSKRMRNATQTWIRAKGL